MKLMLEMVITDYDLIVIEDEITPLGAGPAGTNYFAATAVFVAACLCVIMALVWAIRRRKAKNRLVELINKSGDTSIKVPLSIRKIKDVTIDLEAELTASMLEESFV